MLLRTHAHAIRGLLRSPLIITRMHAGMHAHLVMN